MSNSTDDYKAKGYHSKSEMRRVEMLKGSEVGDSTLPPPEVRERIERAAIEYSDSLPEKYNDRVEKLAAQLDFTKGARAGWAEGRAEIERLEKNMHEIAELHRDIANEADELEEKLTAAQAEITRLREALGEAVEYLEPRLAGKFGSRGLTIVLPRLREALAGKGEA